jgi:hypothetical protein
MKKKKSSKAKASFKETRKHTDKPSAEKMETKTNDNGGSPNRADEALKHMTSHKPSGWKQTSRRTK